MFVLSLQLSDRAWNVPGPGQAEAMKRIRPIEESGLDLAD